MLHLKTRVGYNVTTDGAASAGLRLCQTAWPDCMTLDMHVPDIHGLQFLAAMQVGSHPLPLEFTAIFTAPCGNAIANSGA
jgi:CheY-like chemotaxis protein